METQSNSSSKIFTIASLVLGILALVSLCTGILPLPIGALSIIFAILSKRKRKQLDTMALAGVVTSIAGMAMACVVLIMTTLTLPTLLQDEAYRGQLNAMYESIYGTSFDEMFEETYGMDLDDLFHE